MSTFRGVRFTRSEDLASQVCMYVRWGCGFGPSLIFPYWWIYYALSHRPSPQQTPDSLYLPLHHSLWLSYCPSTLLCVLCCTEPCCSSWMLISEAHRQMPSFGSSPHQKGNFKLKQDFHLHISPLIEGLPPCWDKTTPAIPQRSTKTHRVRKK